MPCPDERDCGMSFSQLGDRLLDLLVRRGDAGACQPNAGESCSKTTVTCGGHVLYENHYHGVYPCTGPCGNWVLIDARRSASAEPMTGSLVLFARASFAVLFVAAVAGKVSGRRRWRAFESSLEPLAGELAGPAAVAVPAAEAICVLLLCAPVAPAWGLVAAGLLLAGFAAGVGYAVRTGRRVRCRCFGVDGGELNTAAAVRNAVLAAAALTAAWAGAALHPAAPSAPAVAFVLPLALAAGYAVTRWDDLVYAFVRPRETT
jgi:methylamine utilization protein MauE